MTIELTRTQVLNLMGELPVNHWFQENLLTELATMRQKTYENVPPVLNIPAPFVATGTCEWECYGQLCGKPARNGYCEWHEDKKCGVCGAKATHGCNVELQFVCDGPLCPAHKRCAGH